MPIFLRNNRLEVEIGEPEEFYSGSRFDHSGNVRQIIFDKKHTFCATEKSGYSSVFGFGLVNEFDINNPAGYSEVQAGEKFLKIGVGSLVKENEEPYHFSFDYKKELLEFEVIQYSETHLEFKAKSPTISGIKTLYRKELSISENKLIIDYYLKNCGEKSFITEEYCHNFFEIDHHGLSSNYQLDFDFELRPDLFSQFVNPEGIVILSQNSVSWKNKPLYDFFIAGLDGNEQRNASWKLINKRDKIGVSEHTNFESSRINLWGNGHVVSPELFHLITLAPGEEVKWQRVYTFFEL